MEEKFNPKEPAMLRPNSGDKIDSVYQNKNIIDLVGEVDLGSSPKIYSSILQQSKKFKEPLIINLEKVTFMDSSGLQILIRLREKFNRRSPGVLLVNPKPQIKKIFQLTGFDKLFPIFEDLDQALAFLEFQQKSGKR